MLWPSEEEEVARRASTPLVETCISKRGEDSYNMTGIKTYNNSQEVDADQYSPCSPGASQ